MKSSGDITTCVVRRARLSSTSHHLASGVALHPFVSQRRTGDVAAQLLDRLAVVGTTSHGSVQAEPVDVSAQVLLETRLPGHDTLHRQRLLAGVWSEGDAVSTRINAVWQQRGAPSGGVEVSPAMAGDGAASASGEVMVAAIPAPARIGEWRGVGKFVPRSRARFEGLSGIAVLVNRMAPDQRTHEIAFD